MNKLALGTAQFGMKYGLSNKNGQVKYSDVENILKFAKHNNIEFIDTAISYGDCEKIIGDVGVKDFKIITKLPDLSMENLNTESWIERSIQSSLKRLKVNSLYGLLIHKSKNLFDKSGKKLINALNKIKESGIVKKIGVSIYEPSECEKILNLTKIDIIQAPMNIMDRRLINSGWLSKLHSEKIEIHARSIFLQGLLLLQPKNIPNYFFEWSKIFEKWEYQLKKNKLNAVDVCLAYPLSIPEVDRVVIGVDNIYQLKEIIDKSKKKEIKFDSSFMISNDQGLINPSNWKIS